MISRASTRRAAPRRFLAALALSLLAAGGCKSKPSEGDCRKAVTRIRELTGTANIQSDSGIAAAVRTCRGTASRESVRCAMESASVEQLERCGLLSKEQVEEITAQQALERQRQREAAPAPDAAPAPPAPTDGAVAPGDVPAGAATPTNGPAGGGTAPGGTPGPAPTGAAPTPDRTAPTTTPAAGTAPTVVAPVVPGGATAATVPAATAPATSSTPPAPVAPSPRRPGRPLPVARPPGGATTP